MNLDTTRARRGAMILERIAEERARRGRKPRSAQRPQSVASTIVRRDVPGDVGGGEAVIVAVEGTGVEKDPTHLAGREYTFRSRSERRTGSTLGKDTFVSRDLGPGGVVRLQSTTDDAPNAGDEQ